MPWTLVLGTRIKFLWGYYTTYSIHHIQGVFLTDFQGEDAWSKAGSDLLLSWQGLEEETVMMATMGILRMMFINY